MHTATSSFDGYCTKGWRRSRKGNLWKRLDDETTVTILRHYDEIEDYNGYSFCVYEDGAEPYFCEDTFRTERWAIRQSLKWLEGDY